MRQVLRPLNGAWPRDRRRQQRSRFDAPWSVTIEQLEREIGHLIRGPREYVLEVDVAESDIRLDGRLRASARPGYPGIIVSFESKHGPLRYIVDEFNDWQDNVRALAKGLEALRMVDRYGITSDGEQYTGFNALPAGRPMGAAMTVDDAARLLASYSAGILPAEIIGNPASLSLAFRHASRATHPDTGGDPDEFRRVAEARDLIRPYQPANPASE